MTTVRVAIAGLGAVGKRVAQLLLLRRDHYLRSYDVDVRLVAVCSSSKGLYRANGISLEHIDEDSSLEDAASGTDWLRDVVGIPDILFECGPSDFDQQPDPRSLPYYRLMLSSGRAIIAASKSALVSHGQELQSLADEHGGWIGLSASAGAALPALDLLKSSVLGCRVDKIEACINATSNFVLDCLVRGTDSMTAMNPQRQALSLEAAIDHARSQGFAERDTSRDIGGFDSMAKLILLSNFGFRHSTNKHWLSIGDIERHGLTSMNVSENAIATWKRTSMTPRLVSTIEFNGKDQVVMLSASVRLRLYPQSHPFSSLRGTTKGIVIHTDEMGEIFASACGEEPDATAASALKDFEAWLRLRRR